VHVGGLVHHVFAREIVAALFKYIDHALRQTISTKGEDVARVAIREVPLHKREVVLHAAVTGPNGIARILGRNRRDNAKRLLEARPRGALPTCTSCSLSGLVDTGLRRAR
jgi:hypothetical protein